MSVTHRRQPPFWLAVHHGEGREMSWGIESNDPSLTFDEHFVCTFGTEMDERSRLAAEYVLGVLQTYAPPRRER